MKKKICVLLLGISILFYALTAVLTIRQQEVLAEKMIRLHVVAQSDSETDQSVKLYVRDRILKLAGGYVDGAETAQEAAERLSPHLDEIEQEAQACLQELSVPNTVTVSLAKEELSTREYDSFTLPAGEYTTLRVVIGSGDGQNWWCVLFPSLCTAATSRQLTEQATAVGLTDAAVSWLTEDSLDVELRFWFLEWLHKWKTRLA